MSHQSTLIELRGVSKRYGSVEALRDVDLAVQTRQIVAVVGDNGAGKSTLVHVLAGLVQPDAGSIAVRGETVRLDSVAKAAELGIASAFQQPQFCENLDVSANIFLGREMRQGLSVRDDAGMYAKAREVLNTLSTPVRAGQSIASLSGGQRQTVAIARTLLNNPSLIVLDEPTASLSVTQTAEVLDYIVRLRSAERSVIMVCHDLPNVFAIADRIVVMRHGCGVRCARHRRHHVRRSDRGDLGREQRRGGHPHARTGLTGAHAALGRGGIVFVGSQWCGSLLNQGRYTHEHY